MPTTEGNEMEMCACMTKPSTVIVRAFSTQCTVNEHGSEEVIRNNLNGT